MAIVHMKSWQAWLFFLEEGNYDRPLGNPKYKTPLILVLVVVGVLKRNWKKKNRKGKIKKAKEKSVSLM